MPFIPESQYKQKQQPQPGEGYSKVGSTVSDLLRTLGLGYIPDVGGSIAAIPQAVASQAIGLSNPEAGARLASMPQFLKPSAEAVSSKPQDQVGAIGRDLAGVASWMMPTPGVFQGMGVAPQLGNIALRGAGRGALYGVSQQHSPEQMLGDATISAVLDPVLSVLTNRGQFAQKTGEDISKAVDTYKGKNPNIDQITQRISDEATKGTNLGESKSVMTRVNSFVSTLEKKLLNAESPSEALGILQDAKSGLVYDPTSNASAKIVDTNIRRILKEEIAQLAPNLAEANQGYASAKALEAIAQGAQSAGSYGLRSGIRYAILYPVLRALMRSGQ